MLLLHASAEWFCRCRCRCANITSINAPFTTRRRLWYVTSSHHVIASRPRITSSPHRRSGQTCTGLRSRSWARAARCRCPRRTPSLACRCAGSSVHAWLACVQEQRPARAAAAAAAAAPAAAAVMHLGQHPAPWRHTTLPSHHAATRATPLHLTPHTSHLTPHTWHLARRHPQDMGRIASAGPAFSDLVLEHAELLHDPGPSPAGPDDVPFATAYNYIPRAVLGDYHTDVEPNWLELPQMAAPLFVEGLRQRNWTAAEFRCARALLGGRQCSLLALPAACRLCGCTVFVISESRMPALAPACIRVCMSLHAPLHYLTHIWHQCAHHRAGLWRAPIPAECTSLPCSPPPAVCCARRASPALPLLLLPHPRAGLTPTPGACSSSSAATRQSLAGPAGARWSPPPAAARRGSTCRPRGQRLSCTTTTRAVRQGGGCEAVVALCALHSSVTRAVLMAVCGRAAARQGARTVPPRALSCNPAAAPHLLQLP